MVIKIRFEGQEHSLKVYSSITVLSFIQKLSAISGVAADKLKCKLIEETR